MSAVATAPVETVASTNGATKSELPKQGKLMFIPLSKIREAQLAIRKTVDKESEKYKQLRDSVRQDGILNPPNAREETDPLSPTEKIYVLVDGLQRTTAAREVGMREIPVHVLDVNALRAMELQFVGNLQRIEMKPAEYSKALVEYLAQNPGVSKLEMALKLSQSTTWIDERLSLANLHADLVPLVDNGTIKLTNAYALAKLPEGSQLQFKDQAIAKDGATFAGLVRAERSAIAKAQREGSANVVPTFEPHPKFKQLAFILNEINSPSELKKLIADSGVSSPLDVALLTAKWCVNLDPVSLKAANEAWDKDQAEKKAAKEAREAERAAKKEKAETAPATA